MSKNKKKNRPGRSRQSMLQNLARHVKPEDVKQQLEQMKDTAVKEATRISIALRQIEDDPFAPDREKDALEEGWKQLDSLLWRVEDIDEQLKGLDKAHIASVLGYKEAMTKRVEEVEGAKAAEGDDGEPPEED